MSRGDGGIWGTGGWSMVSGLGLAPPGRQHAQRARRVGSINRFLSRIRRRVPSISKLVHAKRTAAPPSLSKCEPPGAVQSNPIWTADAMIDIHPIFLQN
jgi:hypothetical protein